jgi:hypothetical protein
MRTPRDLQLEPISSGSDDTYDQVRHILDEIFRESVDPWEDEPTSPGHPGD